MAITNRLREAIKLAVDWHGDQLDKSGYPYICHCLAVMRFQKSEAAQIAAVLHDVIEDADDDDQRNMRWEELTFHCTSEEFAAVDALTKREGEEYMDYIDRVCWNELACHVKLADLDDNLHPKRMLPGEDGRKLREKYEFARKIILSAPESALNRKEATF